MTSRRTRQRPRRAQQTENNTISKCEAFQQSALLEGGRSGSDSHRDQAVPGRRRSVPAELLGVQVLVLLVVRGLGEADGRIAVALADEGLAGLVFAWKRARGEA